MKLSEQQIQTLAQKIAEKTKDSLKFSNPTVIVEVLSMLNEQRPCYSEFEYLGQGGFGLVLKAKNNSRYVALKIVEFVQSKQNAIEAVQREYGILKSLQTSEYIVKLNDSFFLTQQQKQDGEKSVDDGNKEEGKFKDGEDAPAVNRYFVQETELCSGNLAEYLRFCRNNSIKIEEEMKYVMVVQMLDALNFLHQKNIVHRDVKPQNFLFQKKGETIILKLCDFGFSSPLDSNSKSYISGKGTPGYTAPEVQKGQSRKESDNYGLGIIILEIDNYLKFDYSKVTNAEFVHLQEGQGIFPKHNLNTTSELFEIAEGLLNLNYQKRPTAQNLLLKLLKKPKDSLKNFPIYSIIIGNQLSHIPFAIPQLQNKNSQQLEKLKSISISLNPSEETTKKLIDNLVEAYQKSENQDSLSKTQAEGALQALFKLGDYTNLQLLGTGSAGLIIGCLNEKQSRALKICLCKNKVEIFRQIAILKKCQFPGIVKFYRYHFVKDENNNEYVIFEMERCLSSLNQYLDEQCLNNKLYSPEFKMKLSIQMIESVNFLHELKILHGDIKLDNFLISEDDKGEIVVKLTDFDQAAQLEENYYWRWDKESHDDELLPPYNCISLLYPQGTYLYYAPEKLINPLHPTTTKTDAYSLGLCLLVLDNYLTFSEEILLKKQFTLIKPYSEPFIEGPKIKIDRESQIYKIANRLLAFLPNNRSILQKILEESQISELFYSRQTEFPFNQKSKEQTCDFKLDKTQDKNNQEERFKQIANLMSFQNLSLDLSNNQIGEQDAQYLSRESIKLTNLSTLSLDFFCNPIGDNGANYLSTALIQLTNLSSLSLDLFNNSIGDKGADYLSTALIKLTNLSSLSLYLQDNSIGDQGAKYISTAFIKLLDLSSLSLDLYHNSIGDYGAKYLQTALIELTNLSSLSLNLFNNSIGDQGAKYLYTALIELTKLSSLSLNLGSNSIGDQGVNDLSVALIKLSDLSSLSLDLSGNSIGKQSSKDLSTALIELTKLSSLSLNLGSNSIGDQGVNDLSRALIKLSDLSSLSLNLGSNSIGQLGSKDLSTALIELTNLSSLFLYLKNNSIGD